MWLQVLQQDLQQCLEKGVNLRKITLNKKHLLIVDYETFPKHRMTAPSVE